MPVSLSGVMFDPLTLYSEVSQVCGPPACTRLGSSMPPGMRGVWQLPQVRIPSTRYLPRWSDVSADAVPVKRATTMMQASSFIFPPDFANITLRYVEPSEQLGP